MNTRAQVAMEFLMTYGWAIIVVLISILALATFGFLNRDHFTGNQCFLPPGIACVDFKVETARTILVLQNGFGESITLHQVDVARNTGSICSATNLATGLRSQDKAIIIVPGCINGQMGEKFIGKVNVSYTKTSIVHRHEGSIIDKINPSSTITASNNCQNAEDAGLCNGLDVVYGNGYQTSCCGEWGLCCA